MFEYGLVRNEFGRESFNFEDFREFENAILADPVVSPIESGPLVRRTSSYLFRLMRRAGRALGSKPPFGFPVQSKFGWRIAVLGGLAFRRCPHFIFGGRKAAFLFDPTPPWTTSEMIKRFVEDAGISVLFVPHPDCRDELRSVLDHCQVHFVAEAVDPSGYEASATKSIDVIAFGRKHPIHHQAMLEDQGTDFVYESNWHETREDFLHALASSKISMNFPRNMTENNCDIELLTMRYFQAMASKVLLLGHCPALLKEQFGYDPVIKADLDNPSEQVRSILSNFDEYRPLIEKNYQMVNQAHTYRHRWQAMKQILNDAS